MKNIMKHLLIALLALALTATMASCGDKKTDKGESTGAVTTSAPTTEPATTQAPTTEAPTTETPTDTSEPTDTAEPPEGMQSQEDTDGGLFGDWVNKG